MGRKLPKLPDSTLRYLFSSFFLLCACVGLSKAEGWISEADGKEHFDTRSSLKQQVTITGKVNEENGTPIPGVTVSVPGTTIGTGIDLNGDYSIDVPEGRKLVFSFIGFVSQTVGVGDRRFINIVLIEDTAALDEVVVTALGIKRDKKASMTDFWGDIPYSEVGLPASEINLTPKYDLQDEIYRSLLADLDLAISRLNASDVS